MSRYIKLKERLKTELSSDNWKNFINRLAGSGETPENSVLTPDNGTGHEDEAWLAQVSPAEALGPLMGFLPCSGSLHWRAACGIGLVTALQAENPATREKARVTMRRFMWHMNEESGNIGWGIPESMAETLVRSPHMADEFHRILVSYIIDTGNDDNYIEHPPLLASCFWAVGRLAQEKPALVSAHFKDLSAGLEHAAPQVRAQACLALHKLAKASGGKKTWLELDLGTKNQVRHLVNKTETRLKELKKSSLECEDFDGDSAFTRKVSQLADEMLWGNL